MEVAKGTFPARLELNATRAAERPGRQSMPRILTSVRGEDLGYLQRDEEGRLYWQIWGGTIFR
jgi:hypothetical protein